MKTIAAAAPAAFALWVGVASVAGQTAAVVRVVAANLTSGSSQRYETAGLDILKGLRPDVVAIQEFNYASTAGNGTNTPAAFREMLDATFGTNYVYFRETGYSIPNGVVSRYPFVASGTWDDSQISDRGYAWARIDLPGTNDLYVVSVHFKASSGSDNEAKRAAQAAEIKSLIQANFPANAWIIVAGDFNLYSDTEASITTLKTFLSDAPVPVDNNGDPDTNSSRAQRYDRVLPSFSMTNRLTSVALTSHTFTSGLVFDSRVYTPLSDVPPVQSGDSGVSGMQHMAVVKDFLIPLDQVPPPPSVLEMRPAIHITFAGEEGGPFAPSDSCTLTNAGGTTLNWAANIGANWLNVSPANGILGPGQTSEVTAIVNTNANGLVGGLYSNVVSFVNASTGAGTTNVVWTLLVRDGVADAWRQTYFGHVDPRADDQSRAGDDPDGDGQTNLAEYTFGSHPLVGSSAIALQIEQLVSGGIELRFPSVAGRRYSLEINDALGAGGLWMPLVGFTDVTGTGGVLSYVDSALPVARAYRLRGRVQ